MAFCINCGQELVEGAKFCAECGTAVNDSISTNQRKTTFEGEIHKCPNCGDTIDAYETVCEVCGYEIRGRKTTSIVHELALKLEATDEIQKKEELIRNFYIPNTKEDIYEFMILATSNIKTEGVTTKAWLVKLEQAYQKAYLSFSDDKKFEHIKSLYDSCKQQKNLNNMIYGIKSTIRNFDILLIIFGIIIMLQSVLFSRFPWMDGNLFTIGLLVFLVGVGFYIPALIKRIKK